MMWIECKSDEDGQRVLMVKDPISMGRSASCQFSFPNDKEVSRVHAIVEQRGKHWYLSDQQSTNGSFVNGQRVTVPFPLKEGDVIEIGVQLFHVKSGLDFTIRETEGAGYTGYPHLYVLLKVTPSATQEEIDIAYGELTQIFNPSLHPGSAMVQVLLKEIGDAYEVLGDAERRAEYDATLRA